MEKHITNIKDLVIQFMTNGKEIEAKAKEGDAASCFQMGMVHLLGIKASVDFKKASQYFSNQSLADDADAKRLLGLIAEYEGNYSLAFENYANVAGGNSKQSYIETVIKERGNLQSFLKKLDLPTELNKEVSTILVDYVRGGKSKVDASLKIATLCDDQPSCILAAQSLCDIEDYYSASKWLQSGKVPTNNPLYVSVKKNIENTKIGLELSQTIEIVEIEGNALLNGFDASSPYTDTRSICDEVSSSNKLLWIDLVLKMIDGIKKQKAEEEARIKKQKAEEEARRKKQAAEEEARRRKEEEARRRKEEEEEARKKKEEEERLKKKRHKCDGIMLSLYGFFLIVMPIVMYNEERASEGPFFYVYACLVVCLFFTLAPFLFMWWLIRRNIK